MSRRLDFPQRPAQRFDFPLVAGFLALGFLGQPQNLFHLLQSLFQRFDNLPDFLDGFADG